MIASIPGQTNLLCDGTANSMLQLAGGFEATFSSSSILLLLLHNRSAAQEHKKWHIPSEHI